MMKNKVLVIGELCTDVFKYGITNRKSPEGNGPVFIQTDMISGNGMAGNTAMNLEAMGLDVDTHFDNGSITKTRYVHEKSNQMLLRVDEGESKPVDPLTFLSPDMLQTIRESDLIIISDYNKGYLTEEMIIRISKEAKLSLLDTKKKLNSNTIENITFVKLNEIESKHNQELVENHPEKFILTLGSKGAKYKDKIYPSNKPQETIDVSGAGDSFIASFGLMYLKTSDIDQSIEFANDVCSDVVNKRGVSLPDKKFSLRLTF